MQLQLIDLHHSFHEGEKKIKVVNGLNLELHKGEFVSLIGPSGCGKSTLFNLIAGLEILDRGEILINHQNVKGKRGHVSYMMQKDLLFPWKTVLENVTLGASITKQEDQAVKEEALSLFSLFGLQGYENYYPSVLSGGMKQRAALLRTFLHKKELLLLDEPFGALDALTREKMHEWLLRICSQMKRTILFITHSIDEAIFLSNRIYVLSHRPAQIIEEYNVPFEFPRSKDIVLTPEFLELKQKLMMSLYR